MSRIVLRISCVLVSSVSLSLVFSRRFHKSAGSSGNVDIGEQNKQNDASQAHEDSMKPFDIEECHVQAPVGTNVEGGPNNRPVISPRSAFKRKSNGLLSLQMSNSSTFGDSRFSPSPTSGSCSREGIQESPTKRMRGAKKESPRGILKNEKAAVKLAEKTCTNMMGGLNLAESTNMSNAFSEGSMLPDTSGSAYGPGSFNAGGSSTNFNNFGASGGFGKGMFFENNSPLAKTPEEKEKERYNAEAAAGLLEWNFELEDAKALAQAEFDAESGSSYGDANLTDQNDVLNDLFDTPAVNDTYERINGIYERGHQQLIEKGVVSMPGASVMVSGVGNGIMEKRQFSQILKNDQIWPEFSKMEKDAQAAALQDEFERGADATLLAQAESDKKWRDMTMAHDLQREKQNILKKMQDLSVQIAQVQGNGSMQPGMQQHHQQQQLSFAPPLNLQGLEANLPAMVSAEASLPALPLQLSAPRAHLTPGPVFDSVLEPLPVFPVGVAGDVLVGGDVLARPPADEDLQQMRHDDINYVNGSSTTSQTFTISAAIKSDKFCIYPPDLAGREVSICQPPGFFVDGLFYAINPSCEDCMEYMRAKEEFEQNCENGAFCSNIKNEGASINSEDDEGSENSEPAEYLEAMSQLNMKECKRALCDGGVKARESDYVWVSFEPDQEKKKHDASEVSRTENLFLPKIYLTPVTNAHSSSPFDYVDFEMLSKFGMEITTEESRRQRYLEAGVHFHIDGEAVSDGDGVSKSGSESEDVASSQ